MDEDYYKILGVSRNASAVDIQKAYRDLARKYHPDMNPGDDSAKKRFQSVQKAYEVLNDPNKREMYDRYGNSFESMGAGPTGGPGGWRVHTSPGGFDDVDFSQFFGERYQGDPAGGFAEIFRQFTQPGGARKERRRPRPRRGSDLTHELTIPFQTAIGGGEIRLSVPRPDGKTETLEVRIPPGIEDGKKIRLRGQGGEAPGGGQRGDLLIKVQVAPHPHFQRKGDNLEVTVPLTLAEAALGTKIDVPTPKGTITLTVPPGTSSGRKLRVKGHGVPQSNRGSGDLYAAVQIVLPPTLDEETKEWIRKVNYPSNPRTDLKW
jgi:DnaJ-class molecular chaperone